MSAFDDRVSFLVYCLINVNTTVCVDGRRLMQPSDATILYDCMADCGRKSSFLPSLKLILRQWRGLSARLRYSESDRCDKRAHFFGKIYAVKGYLKVNIA